MAKRRSDAANRRFFDEFESVRVSRFRATGVIDPAKRQALIPFPNGTTKLIGTAHTRLKHGGGWSYFICPKCAKLARVLHLIDDAPHCGKCCDAMNIKHASKYGFGRGARRQASDRALDQLIAKLDTTEPLKFKPAHPSWQGKARRVYNSRKLTARMRKRMVDLRLHQLASQQLKDNDIHLKATRGYTPRSEALTAIPQLQQIWRARTAETLQRALDKAQMAILAALESSDPVIRLSAAKLMLNTKQARDRGL